MFYQRFSNNIESRQIHVPIKHENTRRGRKCLSGRYNVCCMCFISGDFNEVTICFNTWGHMVLLCHFVALLLVKFYSAATVECLMLWVKVITYQTSHILQTQGWPGIVLSMEVEHHTQVATNTLQNSPIVISLMNADSPVLLQSKTSRVTYFLHEKFHHESIINAL